MQFFNLFVVLLILSVLAVVQTKSADKTEMLDFSEFVYGSQVTKWTCNRGLNIRWYMLVTVACKFLTSSRKFASGSHPEPTFLGQTSAHDR